MNKIQIDISDQHQVKLVKIVGFMSISQAQIFENSLVSLINNGDVNIVLDLSELEYISSAGLGTIMGSIKHIQLQGGELKIGGMSSMVKNIFDTFGFTTIFKVYNTAQEAVATYNK